MAKETSAKTAGGSRAVKAKRTNAAKRATPKRAAAKGTAARRTAKHAATRRAAPKKTAATRTASAGRKRTATASKTARPTAGARARQRSPRKPREEKGWAIGTLATAVRGTVAGAVAAVTRTVTGGAPDAIVLLETDHRRMEDLLKRGEETSARATKERGSLLDTISAELNAHETIEERIFYPALQRHPEAQDIVMEGFEEHHAADLLLKELHDVAVDNEEWAPKFKVLQETIQHHIDEEEGEMFRTARAVLPQDELDAMGREMAAMKAQVERS